MTWGTWFWSLVCGCAVGYETYGTLWALAAFSLVMAIDSLIRGAIYHDRK